MALSDSLPELVVSKNIKGAEGTVTADYSLTDIFVYENGAAVATGYLKSKSLYGTENTLFFVPIVDDVIRDHIDDLMQGQTTGPNAFQAIKDHLDAFDYKPVIIEDAMLKNMDISVGIDNMQICALLASKIISFDRRNPVGAAASAYLAINGLLSADHVRALDSIEDKELSLKDFIESLPRDMPESSSVPSEKAHVKFIL